MLPECTRLPWEATVAHDTSHVLHADFTGLLFHDTWKEMQSKSDDGPPTAMLIAICSAAAIVSCLNYYWFSLMIKSLVKIFYHGHTWTHASEKTDKKVE